jgi:hypothetical protein
MLKRFAWSLGTGVLGMFVAAMPAAAGQTQAPAAKKPAAATPTALAVPKKFTPKRLPWGDPDISGNFTNKDESNTPFERPDEFAGRRIEDITPQELAAAVEARKRNARATVAYAGGGDSQRGVALGVPIHWLDNLDSNNHRPWFVTDPPDGKIPPITKEAVDRNAAMAKARAGRGTADSYTDRSLGDRCISRKGTPASAITPGLYGNSYQILQTKDFVAIRYDMDGDRVIPLQGRGSQRPHPSDTMKTYFGDSVGHWEGDTLVVDTTNFGDFVNYRGSRSGLHLIERYRRTAAMTVELTITVEDPHTWGRSWSFSMPLTEDDSEPVFEYGCHEGNYGLRNILSAGRSDDRKGIKSSNTAATQGDLLDFEE